MNLHHWIEARLAALPEDAFDSLDDWPENLEPFDASLPGNFVAPLEPVTVTLEYRDAQGEISERPVTLLQLSGTADGPFCLAGRCHLRKARRTFRFDRILSISGLPGLPKNAGPDAVLMALADLSLGANTKDTPKTTPRRATRPATETSTAAQLPPPKPLPEPAPLPPPSPSPIKAPPAAAPDAAFPEIRRRHRAELRLLCFLAKADRDLHAAELDVIETFAAQLAREAGLQWRRPDSDSLATYCRNMAFSREAETTCLTQLSAAAPKRMQTFSETISRLVQADGRVDPAELEMVSRWGVTPEEITNPPSAAAAPAADTPAAAPPKRRGAPPAALLAGLAILGAAAALLLLLR